jgi:RNase P protein component
VNDITLTPDIVQHVLEHRVYHPPKRPTVINYNTMNNFIGHMDFEEKMGHLLTYRQKRIEDIEDGLEKKFQYRVDRLEGDKFKAGCYLSLDDLLCVVNDVTRVDRENIERFNILFDKAVKRFRLYRCKSWESFLEDIGVRELVSLIKSYYLDAYEMYLVRNLHTDHPTELNRLKLLEHLEIYYQFISSFDLSPFVVNFTDQEILGHRLVEESENHLAERYLTVYCEQKQRVKPVERNRTKRKIINIVKENTVHNLGELDKILMELLKVDDSFKRQILQSRELII